MSADPLADLRDATCSDGAPSARNLLVTVFGDALLPYGDDVAVPVRTLARLLDSFGVSERLVRTSLTRLVNDGLLAAVSEGRRSSYRVAPEALELFRAADERIYRGAAPDWDGSWTIVVIDGAEATAARRARLRQELVWEGLGTVAPNVLASPVVPAAEAAAVVGRVGGFDHVLVARAEVVAGAGVLDADELARRCAPVDGIAERYREFVARFSPFAGLDLGAVAPEPAFKLRTLLVASFRRLVLADPLLPAELLPADWIGDRARALAGTVYRGVADAAEAFVVVTAESVVTRPASAVGERFVTAC